MAKEHNGSSWEISEEEARRLFTLSPDDLYFLHTIRVDSQRLYRALVLLWARVERVLLSETESIPETVVKHVSKQLGLAPAVLSQLHNPPSMRSATFEAVRSIIRILEAIRTSFLVSFPCSVSGSRPDSVTSLTKPCIEPKKVRTMESFLPCSKRISVIG